MAILEVEFLDGKTMAFEIEECGDQGGMFSWRGDANQARRYGYIAVRNGKALALNGDASPNVERYPLNSIRRMAERRNGGTK